MLSKLLLIIGILLTIIIYLTIFIIYITTKDKKLSISASENIQNLITSPNINLIKSSNNIFSKYNIPRKTIKLAPNTYDSSDHFSLAISTLLAGYYLTFSNHQSIISKFLKELKFISLSPIITIIISMLTNTAYDSKIIIIILSLIAIYQYLLNAINTDAIAKVKAPTQEISTILKKLTNLTTLAFIITLTQIIRLITIIINFS